LFISVPIANEPLFNIVKLIIHLYLSVILLLNSIIKSIFLLSPSILSRTDVSIAINISKTSLYVNVLGIFTSEKESNYGIKISKEYVETMKGKLWFETKEEAGTTFFVQVPQRITDATPIGSLEDINAVAKVDTANIDYSKYRILIVDDNVLNIKLTTRILSEYNFNIESVTSGNEAVYKVKAGEKYDAIFLDIMMPEMDGVETLHVLEQLEAAKETTIIALTANSISGMKELYLSEGFDEYLAKPIKKKNLEQIISKYFNK
jgi:CheY-like chemotaxis protein